MNLKSTENNLSRQIRFYLAKRVLIAMTLICVTALSLHLAWSISQQSRLADRLLEGFAHTVQGDVEQNDLIRLRRDLEAFQISNEGALFCLRLDNGVEIGSATCEEPYQKFEIPLYGTHYSAAVELPMDRSMLMVGLTLTTFCFLLTAYVLFLLSRVSKQILGDVAQLQSDKQTENLEFAFNELREAKVKITEGLNAKIENERNKAFTEIGEIATQVSHDIRSPLSTLRLLTQMENGHDERSSIIAAAIARIDRIASELLKRAKLHSAASSTCDESVDTGSVITSIVKEKQVCYGANAQVVITAKGSLPSVPNLSIKQSELERAISNLVNNAYEAIEGQGSIVVEGTYDEKNLTISVIDSGKGIAEEDLEKLSTNLRVSIGKSGDSGHGLGLSYARKVTEQNGGQLRIASRLGKGTTVSMSFPC